MAERKYQGEKKKLSKEEALDRSNFAGKVVLITGCTNGIGLAAFEELLSMQTYIPQKLILLNRNKERSDALAEQVRNKGMEVSTYIADLSKPKEVLDVITNILESEPVIDIALLNAGAWSCISETERFVQEDGYEFHYAVNYLQCVLLAQGLATRMSESARASSGESRIVVQGSFTSFDLSKGVLDFEILKGKDGIHTAPGAPAMFANSFTYSQSKLAQHIWVKAKGCDQEGGIAPGVTINIVCPGAVTTNVEVVRLMKVKMGCLFNCIAKRLMGQRSPDVGCKTLLCAGGSKVYKGLNGTHLTFATNGRPVFYAPCDGEWFPQSKWALCPSIADKVQRSRLVKETNAEIEKMKAKYQK
jgi:NAD(P)-dependent dehydrogenase (short-subunit alcohol dehydrogenase family)